MGGVAGAAGQSRLTAPRWLVGGDTELVVVDEVPTVWLVSIADPTARARAEAIASTSADRTEVAGRRDAGERLLRRGLTRLMLASAGGCRPGTVTIARDADGAPLVVAPAGWHLSVAARWPDCAIGVARRPLGVDVERATDEPVAVDLLTAAERDRLAELPENLRARAFAACWAAKEAHAKWTGRPRSLDPASVETGVAGVVTSPLGTTRCWQRHHGALVAAVCTT